MRLPIPLLSTPRYSVIATLLLLISIAYSNSLGASFQFDDFNVIVWASSVQSWPAWWADLGAGMRPLLKASYTLNICWDRQPWGFHLFNLCVHVANSLLIFQLAKAAVQRSDVRADAVAIACLCAGLFAVHPAQTEAITYISGRSSSLMTLFYLLALASYERALQRQRGLDFYLFTPLCFMLALASKETAITLPAALYLWQRCFYPQHTQRAVLMNLAGVSLVVLIAGLCFLAQARYAHALLLSANLREVWVNFFTQLHGMVYLLGQWLWPVQMNIDPDLAVYPTLRSVWREVLLLLAMGGWTLWQHNRLLRFAVCWWLLQLLPLYIFFPRVDGVNDRQLYLAAWPLLLAISYALLLDMQPRKTLIAGCLVCVLLMSTWQRNQDYQDEISLWQATLLSSPNKARAYNNLGYAYYLSGRTVEAQQAYQQALVVDKNFAIAAKNLRMLQQNRQ